MSDIYESNDAMVSHPAHYKSVNGIEAIDVIKDYTRDLRGIYAADTANIIKYSCRWKKKNGRQDIEKTIWYASHLLNEVQNYRIVRINAEEVSHSIPIGLVMREFTDGYDEQETEYTRNIIFNACTWVRDYDLAVLIEYCKLLLKHIDKGDNKNE